MTLDEAIRQMRREAPNDEHYHWADRIEEEINMLAEARDWYKAKAKRLIRARGLLNAKLHRLQSTNHHIASMLSNAERAGSETDRPEGARYITLSDTLARQIAKELTAEDDEK